MFSKMEELEKELGKYADKEKAKLLQRFFKTGKGEYGEGDIFLGLTVPKIRDLARRFPNLDFDELQDLLNSKIHEKRMLALVILVNRYKKSKDDKEKKRIFDFYLANTRNINNWDLVDVNCKDIVGRYLFDKDRKILYKLAKSRNLWEKRIAIVSTSYFIWKNQFEDTLRISEILLKDKHDLIHKAVGWMLREIGKRDLKVEENFLKKHYKKMPRTMLRYAIEKFDEGKRLKYLNGQI